MKLSIIIVNYRAWKHLGKALDALLPGFPMDEWEVIIVDNESQAKPLQDFQSKHPWVHFIANPANSGFAYANNLGAARARGSQLLFMNPDVVASSHEIRTLVEEKERLKDVAIAAPRQTNAKGALQKVFDDFPTFLNQSKTLKSLLRRVYPAKHLDPREDHREQIYCDWVSGSVFLMSRDDFDAVDGWSTDYWMYVEDTDLCWRTRQRGRLTAYIPSVTVIHAHGGSSRQNPELASMTKLEVIISRHVFVSKHFPSPRKWFTHAFIAALKLPPLMLAAFLNLITLGRVTALHIRHRIFTGLVRYYLRVFRTGTWRSTRSLANDQLAAVG